MTDQRILVLCSIVEFFRKHHFSPSHREIADYIDAKRSSWYIHTSTSSIRFHLQELHKRGYIYYEPGVARGYAPTLEGMELIRSLFPESAKI